MIFSKKDIYYFGYYKKDITFVLLNCIRKIITLKDESL